MGCQGGKEESGGDKTYDEIIEMLQVKKGVKRERVD
jgi:hypothetical protein